MRALWFIAIHYYTTKLHEKYSYYVKVIYLTFLWFIGEINVSCFSNIPRSLLNQ